MGLERDIKQKKPFKSEHEKALVNLLYTTNWLNDQLKGYFKPFDITPTQYNILRILNGAEKPMTTFEIRERMLNKMSDITRLIDRLIRKEYVLKKTHRDDKRLVDIVISPQGRSLLSKIGHHTLPLASIMQKLNHEESAMLNKTLDKLRQ